MTADFNFGYFVNMLRATNRKGNTKRKRARIRGIVAAANDLGVSRVHLWQVITGRRQSKRLLARYKLLTE